MNDRNSMSFFCNFWFSFHFSMHIEMKRIFSILYPFNHFGKLNTAAKTLEKHTFYNSFLAFIYDIVSYILWEYSIWVSNFLCKRIFAMIVQEYCYLFWLILFSLQFSFILWPIIERKILLETKKNCMVNIAQSGIRPKGN